MSEMLLPLLLGSGLLKRKEIDTAKKVAVDLDMALEEALVDAGMISEEKMANVLDALKRVGEKEITLDLAIRAVRIATHKKMDLEAAIKAVSNLHQTTGVVVTATNELTKLILGADIIKRDDLGRALKQSRDEEMMVGQALLINKVVSVKGMLAALSAILTIRVAGLEKDKATQALRYANQRGITFEQALFELGFFIHPDSKDLRIEELFQMAKVVSDQDMAECIEIELFKQKDFGQILLERALITEEHLESAQTLLSSIASGTLKPYQAADALFKVCKEDADVYGTIAAFQILHKPDTNDRLGDLLVESGACTRDQIEKAFSEASESAVRIGSVLLKASILKESTLYNALRLQTLLRFGYLERNTVVELLTECVRQDVALDDVLEEKEIYVPSRMQWTWV